MSVHCADSLPWDDWQISDWKSWDVLGCSRRLQLHTVLLPESLRLRLKLRIDLFIEESLWEAVRLRKRGCSCELVLVFVMQVRILDIAVFLSDLGWESISIQMTSWATNLYDPGIFNIQWQNVKFIDFMFCCFHKIVPPLREQVNTSSSKSWWASDMLVIAINLIGAILSKNDLLQKLLSRHVLG